MASLLDASDLELIRKLELSTHRRLAGQATGEQRSPALGGGIEFADYREYIPGDDIRQVDWSVFRRLRKLLVKLSAEERELTLMLLVDTSRSMDYGQPSKDIFARRIAAVLGGIALTSGNQSGVLSWGDELREVLPPQRGSRMVPFLVEQLSRLRSAGVSRPIDCARTFASRHHRRCLAVLLTDLMHEDWSETLKGLAASGCEVHLIHVVAPEEEFPLHRGELTLVDNETGKEASVLVDAPLLDVYRREWKTWLDEIQSQCRAQGLSYVRVSSDGSLARLFLEDLKKTGLVC